MNLFEELQNQVRKKMKSVPAHDFTHVMRVYDNAKKLCKQENGNEKLVLSAALLHDVVSYRKSDRRSNLSSVHSAKESKKILKKLNYTPKEIEIICDAIRDHSFSRGKTPKTIEGKILQDADRLDALGAVGLARVFTVGGHEKRQFYNPVDPFCKKRIPDDKTWTLDHFYQKLLKLESQMNTNSAKIEAKKRTRLLKIFLLELKREV